MAQKPTSKTSTRTPAAQPTAEDTKPSPQPADAPRPEHMPLDARITPVAEQVNPRAAQPVGEARLPETASDDLLSAEKRRDESVKEAEAKAAEIAKAEDAARNLRDGNSAA